MIQDKVDLDDHNDLKELLLELPRVDEVSQLRSYVMNNIERFHLDNKTFHEDFKTQNEIIRRYDEVLSQKVSGITLEQETMKLYDDFDERFKDMKLLHEKLGEELQVSHRKLTVFEEAMRKEIDEKIKEELKIERRKSQ